MEIQKYFDEVDKNIGMYEANLVEKAVANDLDLTDEKIAIFKRISNEDYYYPFNKTALKYCSSIVSKNFRRLNNNTNFRVLNDKDQTEIRNQFNLLLNLLKKIRMKKRGKVKVDQNILVFEYKNNDIKPLNENSIVNYTNIFELLVNTPKSNENLWKKLNIDLK